MMVLFVSFLFSIFYSHFPKKKRQKTSSCLAHSFKKLVFWRTFKDLFFRTPNRSLYILTNCSPLIWKLWMFLFSKTVIKVFWKTVFGHGDQTGSQSLSPFTFLCQFHLSVILWLLVFWLHKLEEGGIIVCSEKKIFFRRHLII